MASHQDCIDFCRASGAQCPCSLLFPSPPSLGPKADDFTTSQQVIWCPVSSHLRVYLTSEQTKHSSMQTATNTSKQLGPAFFLPLHLCLETVSHPQGYGSSPYQFIKSYRDTENTALQSDRSWWHASFPFWIAEVERIVTVPTPGLASGSSARTPPLIRGGATSA